MQARGKDAFWFGCEYELFWMLEFSLGLQVVSESEKAVAYSTKKFYFPNFASSKGLWRLQRNGL